MFLDEVEIEVTAGKGGDGVVHFRREKYVPRGGPDGGDGGRGGHVILRVRPTMHGLNWYREKKRFHAAGGRNGGSANKTGRDGEDLELPVPPGTLVRVEPEGEVVADLTRAGDEWIAARGGRGGRGNTRFATARRQAPRLAERGEPGEQKRLRLEVRLLADIGIIGAPNAGKSTLLAALTEARPKIADYPFTSLQPNLGVAEVDGRPWVLADIPGLIAGAHDGAGLGDRFLRHIRRTRCLIHLLDGAGDDPLGEMDTVNAELAAYDGALAGKRKVVAVNKIDVASAQERWPEWQAALARRGIQALAVSARARTNLEALLQAAVDAAQAAEVEAEEEEVVPVHRPRPDDGFAIARELDGAWRVSGRGVERAAAMTTWEFEDGVRRFQRSLGRMGVEDALRQAGVRPGDTVRIGEYELEWEE